MEKNKTKKKTKKKNDQTHSVKEISDWTAIVNSCFANVLNPYSDRLSEEIYEEAKKTVHIHTRKAFFDLSTQLSKNGCTEHLAYVGKPDGISLTEIIEKAKSAAADGVQDGFSDGFVCAVSDLIEKEENK